MEVRWRAGEGSQNLVATCRPLRAKAWQMDTIEELQNRIGDSALIYLQQTREVQKTRTPTLRVAYVCAGASERFKTTCVQFG